MKLKFEDIPNSAGWYSAKYLDYEYSIFAGEYYEIYFQRGEENQIILTETELNDPVGFCERHLEEIIKENERVL